MESPNEHIEVLTKNLEEYEKNTKRRIWISSLIPLLFGLLFLGYTAWQIRVYGEKLAGVQIELTKQTEALNAAVGTLESVNGQLNQSNQHLNELQVTSTAAANNLQANQQQLQQLGNQLTQTTNDLQNTTDYLYDANSYIKYRVEIDPFGFKDLYSYPQYERQAELLDYLFALQAKHIHFNPRGFTEEEGFNSPNFTVYVMEQCGLISPNYKGDAGPKSMLHLDNEGPKMGEIISDGLGAGFSMFYFEIEGREFIMGMTTQGILTLDPAFIKQPIYYEVPYGNPFTNFDCPPGLLGG